MLSAVKIAEALHIDYNGADCEFTRITTDSRDIKGGEIFVALVGEKFDGHNFLTKAAADGAKAVVISHDIELPAEIIKFIVPDTLAAYQEIAAAHRKSMSRVKVIGLTGSNGKTSTKDFLAKCLATKYKVVKTQANFNNEIGLPKTLFDITADTDIAVVEMGMRGMHQIESLCRLAKPESGLVTNVGDAHLELLGSHENIAKAKSELVVDLPRNGYAVLNGDNEYTRKMGEVTSADKVFFGFNPENDYYAENVTMNLTGTDFVCVEKYSGKKVNVHLPVLGAHNVYNALAAMTMALCYGVDLEASAQALRDAVLSQRRLELVQKQGITFIDDSYNASPASMKGALETLQLVKQGATGKDKHPHSIAVLADMLELGDISEEAHRNVGKLCVETKVDYLFTYGDLGHFIYAEAKKQGIKSQYCKDVDDVYRCLNHVVCVGDIVLLKGSHSMEVNQVLNYFGK